MTPGTPEPLLRYGRPTAVLDSREAAAYLAISERGLYRLVQAGELPHTRVGKALRFRLVDLDLFLEERTSRTWEPEDGRGRPRKVPAKG